MFLNYESYNNHGIYINIVLLIYILFAFDYHKMLIT